MMMNEDGICMCSDCGGRVAFLESAESIDMQSYDLPAPEPGSILTEVVRTNICGSELHIWSGDHPLIEDGVLGHEALCRITELGDGVTTDYNGNPVEEGDLIVPAYFITCGKCEYCGRGEFGYCENAYREWSKPPMEAPHFNGTFGTHYYIHPDQYFYRVSESIDESAAASANCALSQVLFGLDEVGVSQSDSVVIQGLGGLGLNAIAVANEKGAETIAIDGVGDRLEMAEEFGADHLIDMREHETVDDRAAAVEDLTGGLGADVAVEVTGVPDAFTEGIQLLRKGGSYLEMGNIIPGETTEFDPGKMTRKSIDVVSTMRYDPWYLQEALSFLEQHGDKYPFGDLIDAEFSLNEIDDALAQSRDRSVTRASLIPE